MATPFNGISVLPFAYRVIVHPTISACASFLSWFVVRYPEDEAGHERGVLYRRWACPKKCRGTTGRQSRGFRTRLGYRYLCRSSGPVRRDETSVAPPPRRAPDESRLECKNA